MGLIVLLSFIFYHLFLLQAARYDDIEDVVSLSTMGVSLDSKDSQGRTGSDLHILLHVMRLSLCHY